MANHLIVTILNRLMLWVRDPIIRIFLAYLFIMNVFALLYWALYENDNYQFSFNETLKSSIHWDAVTNSYALIGALKLAQDTEFPISLEKLEHAYGLELENRGIISGEHNRFRYPTVLSNYSSFLNRWKARGEPDVWTFCNWFQQAFMQLSIFYVLGDVATFMALQDFSSSGQR